MSEDDYTHPEMVRATNRIEQDVREIKSDLKQQAQHYVTRGEFEAWRTAMDREVKGFKDAMKSAIDDLKSENMRAIDALTGAKAPWWHIATVVIAAAALIIALIPSIANG